MRRFQREERLGAGEVMGRLLRIASQQETTKFCDCCNQQVLALRPGTSRLRQLTLTIVTLGVWSVVWVVEALRRPGWRCSKCGQRL